MNMPAREGRQGPEDRGEHGWEALPYELGHWDCLGLLARVHIESCCVDWHSLTVMTHDQVDSRVEYHLGTLHCGRCTGID